MLERLKKELHQLAAPVPERERKAVFFKTALGEYGEHDQFLGVPTPQLRKIAKTNRMLPLESVIGLLQSSMNEERLLALFMLVDRYQNGNETLKKEVYQLYQRHIKHINNWNLVDASAHLIVGAHLNQRDKQYLLKLSSSHVLWERRIAIVATWYFIRQNEFEWTLKIAEALLNDQHDLIHKAVGWMLREMGKRQEAALILFLENHAYKMPRTMLRYAIEKLNTEQRKAYLTRRAGR